MLCGSLILKFEILQTTMKKQNKKYKNAKSIGEKLKTKGLMFFAPFFSCNLQDLKFWYVNRKVFGASFLYWVDFTVKQSHRSLEGQMYVNIKTKM